MEGSVLEVGGTIGPVSCVAEYTFTSLSHQFLLCSTTKPTKLLLPKHSLTRVNSIVSSIHFPSMLLCALLLLLTPPTDGSSLLATLLTVSPHISYFLVST